MENVNAGKDRFEILPTMLHTHNVYAQTNIYSVLLFVVAVFIFRFDVYVLT